MNDPQFPGFENDDEESKPLQPAKPPAKPPAAKLPQRPATAAIAKPSAEPPPLKPAAAPSYEFEESAPAEPKKKSYAQQPTEKTPATMHPVLDDPAAPKAKTNGPARQAPPAPTAPADEDPVDPDLKPGSRKDLWDCPHCGTKNKPGRPTCRKCNKSPDDAIETPWFKKPGPIGGIVAGVVLLILIIAMTGGTDLTMKPADAASIDSKVRVGGSASGTRDVDTHAFTPTKRLSVCGRCLGSTVFTPAPGGWTVVLLLGKAARADDSANDTTVTFNGERTDVTASGTTCVLHLIPGAGAIVQPVKGRIISLSGQKGELEGSLGGYGEHTVLVEGFAQSE